MISGNGRPEVVGALGVLRASCPSTQIERAAGGADRLQHLAERAAAVVFDDDAGGGGEVGADEGIDTFGVADADAETGSSKRLARAGLSTSTSSSQLGVRTASSSRTTNSV